MTKKKRGDIIILHFERKMDMAQKVDPNKLEELIVKYFDYMASLKKEIRGLKSDIKDKQALLKEQEKIEKRYIDLLVSDNTGKGEYRDALFLPSEIKETIDKDKKLTNEEKESLKEKYELAVEQAKKLEEEYKNLMETATERGEKIKTYRKEVGQLKRKLTKKEKEYNENMTQVKKLDKKLGNITKLDTNNSAKKLVNKPNDNKGQK